MFLVYKTLIFSIPEDEVPRELLYPVTRCQPQFLSNS